MNTAGSWVMHPLWDLIVKGTFVQLRQITSSCCSRQSRNQAYFARHDDYKFSIMFWCPSLSFFPWQKFQHMKHRYSTKICFKVKKLNWRIKFHSVKFSLLYVQFVSWTLLSHFIDLGGRFSTPDSPSIHKLPKLFYIISTSIIYVDLWGRATWSFKNLLKFTEFKLPTMIHSVQSCQLNPTLKRGNFSSLSVVWIKTSNWWQVKLLRWRET